MRGEGEPGGNRARGRRRSQRRRGVVIRPRDRAALPEVLAPGLASLFCTPKNLCFILSKLLSPRVNEIFDINYDLSNYFSPII
jgi:hypothetical protein